MLRSHREERAAWIQRLPVILVAIGSALVAALGGSAPTGIEAWDVVLAGALAGSVVLAASAAWAWATAPLLAPLFVLGAPMPAVLGAAAASVLLLAGRAHRPSRPLLKALAAAIAIGLLMRLPPVGFFGLPSLIVAVAVIPLLSSVLLRSCRKRRATCCLLVALAGTAALIAGAAFHLPPARADAFDGAASARRGLVEIRDGNREAGVRELARATAHLDAAHARLDAWWLRPVRLVPVASQNLVAGTSLAEVAASVSASVEDLARIEWETLRRSDGSVDVDRLSEMRPELLALERTLSEAAATITANPDSPWLLPVVHAASHEVLAGLDTAQPKAALAVAATEALPRLLGGEGLRRYLVMFANPGEARELGGILGSHLEITADGGTVTVTGAGSATTLNTRPPSTLRHIDRFTARFLINDPLRYSQNWTGMTDLASVAAAAADLYPSRGGRPIDGVIYLDPKGIAALLGVTGPVEVANVPYPITAQNAAQFLLVEQYRFFDDHAERKDLLTDVGADAFTRLLSLEPAELGAVAPALGPATRGGHLRMETFDDIANDFLERIGLREEVEDTRDGDHLSVVHTNGAANKLDTFLHRHVRYDVEIDAITGALDATAEIRLENRATGDLPAYVLGEPVNGVPGTNLVQLSIYTPHTLEFAEVDGRRTGVEIQHERGLNRYIVAVAVPPGANAIVTYRLSGDASLDDGRYRLALGHQPVVNADTVGVSVIADGGVLREPVGLRITTGGEAAGRFELRDARSLGVDVIASAGPVRGGRS